MTHNPYLRHNDVSNIGLANASAAEGEASIQRILGYVIRWLSKKKLYTNFGTSFSDANVSLTMKTPIFQSLNTDEGFWFQE